ncbi:hypothetical protein GOBAR_DD31922 [Gossypium barbadense]|nr:hypothetical protein GOBAR_DD31922 [Gossypium barbadense]
MVQSTNPNKLNWENHIEDEENINDLAFSPFPPRQDIGLDKKRINKVIKYKLNEYRNKVIKVTSTLRVRIKMRLVAKMVTTLLLGALTRTLHPKTEPLKYERHSSIDGALASPKANINNCVPSRCKKEEHSVSVTVDT